MAVDKESLRDFCASNDVEELALFGSVLRDDFADPGDIEVLMRFSEGARVSLLKLGRYEEDLAKILDRKNSNRRVDLKTPKSINPKLIPKILAGRLVLYNRSAGRQSLARPGFF